MMNYRANLNLDSEELSIIQTILDDYVNKNTGHEFVGVEFERALAHKIKVILDIKRIKRKESSSTIKL
jgi:hypothetical protein